MFFGTELVHTQSIPVDIYSFSAALRLAFFLVHVGGMRGCGGSMCVGASALCIP